VAKGGYVNILALNGIITSEEWSGLADGAWTIKFTDRAPTTFTPYTRITTDCAITVSASAAAAPVSAAPVSAVSAAAAG
jgi:hypothetical protein